MRMSIQYWLGPEEQEGSQYLVLVCKGRRHLHLRSSRPVDLGSWILGAVNHLYLGMCTFRSGLPAMEPRTILYI